MKNTTAVLKKIEELTNLNLDISNEEKAKIIAADLNMFSHYIEILDLVNAELTPSLLDEDLEIINNNEIKDEINGIADEDAYETYKNKLGIKEEDIDSVKSYVYPNGMIGFSVKFKEGQGEASKKKKEVSESFKLKISEYLDNRKKLKTSISLNEEALKSKKIGIVPLADFHIGAYVEGLIKTEDFSINKIIDYLDTVANVINDILIKKLNHVNEWNTSLYEFFFNLFFGLPTPGIIFI
jgi:hypothetical protein